MSLLTAWRLCAAKYAATAFDGEGARLHGGRWSLRGIPVVYTSESRALAVIEVLANVDERDRLLDIAWVLISAEVATGLIEKPVRYPADWRAFPRPVATREFGAAWAREQRSAVLRVPSAVVPGEFNYLLNPAHPAFSQIKIGKPEPFTFDPRLKA